MLKPSVPIGFIHFSNSNAWIVFIIRITRNHESDRGSPVSNSFMHIIPQRLLLFHQLDQQLVEQGVLLVMNEVTAGVQLQSGSRKQGE